MLNLVMFVCRHPWLTLPIQRRETTHANQHTHFTHITETDVTLRPTMGHHAHAAFLAILRESDPETRRKTPRTVSAKTIYRLTARREGETAQETTLYQGRHRLQTPIHVSG